MTVGFIVGVHVGYLLGSIYGNTHYKHYRDAIYGLLLRADGFPAHGPLILNAYM